MKTGLPSFDILCYIDVVVVVVVVSLLPGNFSSTRLGGMRGAIESGHRALRGSKRVAWVLDGDGRRVILLNLPPITE